VSVPVVVAAIGAALAAVGLTGGLWLVLVGAEIGLFGLVWLAREIVLERRAVRR
jgi:predicted tellurium resistance membrane protein TerC